MGFLSDFNKAKRAVQKAQKVQKQGRQTASRQQPMPQRRATTVTSHITVSERKGRGTSPIYAEPEEFNPLPILTLRDWNYGDGLEPDTNGYGFTAPDGRIWTAGKCKWSLWPDLGVLVVKTIGTKYHVEDLSDESFMPSKALKLVAEPENPHSENGTAIAVRNWANDRTAGYIKSGSTARLRNLLRGEEFHVMSLNARYAMSDGTPRKLIRTNMKFVIFREGRLLGCDHVPACPPIAEPPGKDA